MSCRQSKLVTRSKSAFRNFLGLATSNRVFAGRRVRVAWARWSSIDPAWKSKPVNCDLGKALAISTVDQPWPQPMSATFAPRLELGDHAVQ